MRSAEAAISPALARISIRELGRLLREGALSPVALAEYCLHRLESAAPRYNALVTLTRKRALDSARRAERELKQNRIRGPLHGIPFGLKDLFATSGGYPTTWGFEPYKNRQIDSDAAVVRRLEQAGAVLVAKLALVELAGGMNYKHPQGSSYLGPGINPWNPKAWSGGSSSGSAIAVAAGLVPFAIGTETHGSITSPAAFCGVSGLRPGFGRVSRQGCMALSWSLDKIGPLAAQARDCGLVLEAISGPDPDDAATLAEPFRYRPRRPPRGRKWRLGILMDEEVAPDQPEVMERLEKALEVLRPDADLIPARLPGGLYREAVLTILFAEAGAALAELTEKDMAEKITASESWAVPFALQTIPAQAYLNALRLRKKMARELAPWLAGYDALIGPTQKLVAPPLRQSFNRYFGIFRWQPITSVGNLLGWPALSIPNGFGQRGLPTAMQFIGAPGSENVLLGLADYYQARTEWHQLLPGGI